MNNFKLIFVFLVAAVFLAGCDSKEAQREKAAKELRQNARDYKADYGDGKSLYNPGAPAKSDEGKK